MRANAVAASLFIITVMFILTVGAQVFVDDAMGTQSLFACLLAGTIISSAVAGVVRAKMNAPIC